MIRTSPFIARTLVGAFVLVAALGWTVFEVLTAERSFEGRITIQTVQKLPDGKLELLDQFQGSKSFRASILEVAQGKRQVETKWVLSDKTAKGRAFSVRLAQRGAIDRNLQTGHVKLSLPLQWTVDGKTSQSILELSTDRSITGPNGAVSGQPLKIQNRQSPIRVVGELVDLGEFRKIVELEGDELIEERAAQPGAVDKRVSVADRGRGTPSLLIIAEGIVKAAEQ